MHAVYLKKSNIQLGLLATNKNVYIYLQMVWHDSWLTVSANPIAVPRRWFGTVAFIFIALVRRVAVPPARADGGRVDIGRADVRPLTNW